MRALIVSGAGRYADPWHPFPATSPLLAGILEAAGFATTIDEDVDGALADLDGVDLLVVNAGDPWRNDAGDAGDAGDAASRPGAFTAALARGLGVLALHCAVASLRDYPDWAPAIGALWLPTVSFHPPAGEADITGLGLPTGEPVESFRLFDERYCRLQPVGHSRVVARHAGPTGPEPTAWVREHAGARIAVDVLGHDERSYASPGHRRLVRQLALWAVRPFPSVIGPTFPD
ncbi:hypothetical protein GCM10022223_59870 [Kineosporia mesophila]|uniref:ThuA-like domain-containing protein n=1 Tax=Kineosporia mesophila TaxID=566012 RepID=A0ABP7AJ98_9ACTN|nr:ThuA domain-containing protein [Kineosporia mesophila]MCD5352442.1 ThuA domain-containing protein [Kineosporia mesophila]